MQLSLLNFKQIWIIESHLIIHFEANTHSSKRSPYHWQLYQFTLYSGPTLSGSVLPQMNTFEYHSGQWMSVQVKP